MSKADEVVRDLRRIAKDLPTATRASTEDRQRVLAAIDALHAVAMRWLAESTG
jgi:hypothetical protein